MSNYEVKEEFEDTKGVIEQGNQRRSENTKVKRKGTNNDRENTTEKTKVTQMYMSSGVYCKWGRCRWKKHARRHIL
jgi:hypothetical protein